MLSTVDRQSLAKDIEIHAGKASSAEELMSLIVGRLKEHVPHYDWVGFYMMDESGGERVLVLGPFVGAETPHKRIPLDEGICGAAASSGHTIIVDDVNQDPRYLACSISTKSEIVAPVWAKGKIVGELDIDSHSPAAFGPEDRDLVEHCARLVGRLLDGRE